MNLRKNLGRVASTIVATALLASVATVPAFAATTQPGGMSHETNSFTFKAGVDLTEGTPYAPDVDITYTLAPANPLPTEAKENLAKSGVANAINTSAETYDNVAALDAETTADDVTFVFTPNNFGAVGIYYYTLSANVPTVTGLTATQGTWTVKVYVQNEMQGDVATGNFEIADVTMYKTGSYTEETESWDDVTKSGDINGGTDGKGDYAATYDSDALTLTKKLSGNMANMSDKFGFTITITDPDANKYASKVDYVVVNGEKQTVEFDGNGVATITVNAQSGIGNNESISVTGIPEGANVTIVEADKGYNNGEFNNDYTATWTGATVDEANDKTATASASDGTTAVEVTNSKTTVNPTGIVMNVAPYALLVVVAVAGCFVFLRKRNED